MYQRKININLLFLNLIFITGTTKPFVIKLFQDISLLTRALDEHNKRNREALTNGFKKFFSKDEFSENFKFPNFAKNPIRSQKINDMEDQNIDERNKPFTFNNLAGAVPVDVYEIVDFLKYPEKFKRVGATMPKGILLVGPPGTGKTSIARAIAGEADAAFFNTSGSQFIEVYVGTGPQRVRELFDNARAAIDSGFYKKAIIFIDELDAVGGQRQDFSNSEYRNTLNELLNQMDGFNQDNKILVVGATNTPDSIDSALKRPGRFDRIVYIGLPSEENRLKILKYYANKLACDSKTIDLKAIAENTELFSPAELKNLINEAAIRAARENCNLVSQKHFTQALESIQENQSLRN